MSDFETVDKRRGASAPSKMGEPGFDVELFMQFTVILEALKIAEGVARLAAQREHSK